MTRPGRYDLLLDVYARNAIKLARWFVSQLLRWGIDGAIKAESMDQNRWFLCARGSFSVDSLLKQEVIWSVSRHTVRVGGRFHLWAFSVDAKGHAVNSQVIFIEVKNINQVKCILVSSCGDGFLKKKALWMKLKNWIIICLGSFAIIYVRPKNFGE